jgi:hypothetical protein
MQYENSNEEEKLEKKTFCSPLGSKLSRSVVRFTPGQIIGRIADLPLSTCP